MTKNLNITVIVFALILAAIGITLSSAKPASASATSQCDVTNRTVAIGNQASTTVLVNGSYQWAIIEQPTNATNTVSVTIGSIATKGAGLQLTPATSTSPVPLVTLGYAPNLPFRGAISAITSSGSTTINVVSCK